VKADVVLAGVGGQGVLSIAAVLAEAARRHGLAVIQAEVHGMAQRGGAVVAGLRIADGPIAGALIPRGSADLLLGTEPVEALRYADRLSPGGTLLSAAEPFENIPDYPPITGIHDRVRAIPGALLVEARALAEEAGSRRSANVVMVGAASRFLPIPQESILECIREAFAAKGERMAKVNERAFAAGREATTAPAAP
jgi:indolepyruvate ferredoxin oxidoreductase beta subunit